MTQNSENCWRFQSGVNVGDEIKEKWVRLVKDTNTKIKWQI
jgi:chromosome condensin MukBEF MukE localization factor